MKRQHALLAVLTPFVLLSGCVEDSRTDSTDDPPGDDPAIVESLEYDGCREMIGIWDLDYDDVAPFLPPGFEPDSSLLPPQQSIGRNASIDLLGISCTEPVQASLLIPWLTVTPPDSLVHPEADAYRIMLPCIGDASIAQVLQAWGAPCTAGEVGFTTDSGTEGADMWTFEAQSPEVTIKLEGIGVATEELSDEPVFRQFHVTQRSVCAITHLELEDHIHWRGHGFTVEANGEAPFPIPDEPSAGLLAMPDFQMKMTPMAMEDEAKSDSCPQ